MILDLRPVDLDDLGLIAAIRSNAERHLAPRGVEVQVTVQGTPRRLPPELEITLFRIVQETCNNIAIHAAAQHVNISIAFREQAVQVVVEDDGRGFDVTSVVDSDNKERGFGLLGMQEACRTCRRHSPDRFATGSSAPNPMPMPIYG